MRFVGPQIAGNEIFATLDEFPLARGEAHRGCGPVDESVELVVLRLDLVADPKLLVDPHCAFPLDHWTSVRIKEVRSDDVAAGQPLQRVGRPEDMEGAICYLCSDAGSFVTGNIISNDGGVAIR